MITDKKRYFHWLEKELKTFGKGRDIQIFLFGSSVQNNIFYDVDVGITGTITDEETHQLKQDFEESSFPYPVDIVNFNTVKKTFSQNVLQGPKIWIKH